MGDSECVVANVGGVGGTACGGAGGNGVGDGKEVVGPSGAIDVRCADADDGGDAGDMTEASVEIGSFNTLVTSSSEGDSESSSGARGWWSSSFVNTSTVSGWAGSIQDTSSGAWSGEIGRRLLLLLLVPKPSPLLVPTFSLAPSVSASSVLSLLLLAWIDALDRSAGPNLWAHFTRSRKVVGM